MPGPVAVQGVRGCFSQQAATLLAPGREIEFCETMRQAFSLVADGKCSALAVPVRNTIAGDIASHLALAVEHPALRLEQEIDLPVRLHLMAPHGARLDTINRAASHPVALQQCSRFFATHPGIAAAEFFDTAGAARDVAARGVVNQAAIASEAAASEYGLTIVVRDIQDTLDNQTEFWLLAR